MRSNRSEVFVVPFDKAGQPEYRLGERKTARKVKRITIFPQQQYAGPAELTTTLSVFPEVSLANIVLVLCDKDGEILMRDCPAMAFVNVQKGAPPAALLPKPRLDVADLPIVPWKSYAYSTVPKTGLLIVQFEYT